MRNRFWIKFGALLYLPALAVALAWIGLDILLGEESTDRWIDSLPEPAFWALAALIFAGLFGVLLLWWGKRWGQKEKKE